MYKVSKSTVPEHIEDAVMKSITEVFRDDALKFFGINEKIISEVNTEITNIEVDKLLLDKLFLLEDGTYVHLEYQSTNRKKDLARFLAYDALAYYKYGNNIKTIVIYSSDITEAETELSTGNIIYKVSAFYMYLLDGDKSFEELSNKIHNKRGLTKEDILKMAFIPLMKSTKNKNERAIEAVKLFKNAENEYSESKEIELCLGLMYALFQKFIDNEYQEELKGVFKMTKLGTMLIEEGIEEGIKKGIEKGAKRKSIEIAKNMLKKGMDTNTIIEVTGLKKEEIEIIEMELQ